MENTFSFDDHSHRRFNILTGDWVLVSPHRTKRPWQGKTEEPNTEKGASFDETCYLCPGNVRAGGQHTPQYDSTYVFTNDFSALLPDTPTYENSNGLLKVKSESGVCKVICFSPDHSLTIPEMDLSDIVKVVKVWKQEFAELGSLAHINNVQIFENKGAIQGCSNPHPHGQIWSQSSIPLEIQVRTDTQQSYFEKHGRSMLGDYLAQELEAKERIIAENEHFAVLIPFWAIWPYETMVIPKRHMKNILALTEDEEKAFADIIKVITVRYDNLFKTSFPYSAGIQQAPCDGLAHEGWHFHYSFYPPLLRSASVKKFMVGYEMFAEPQRDITAEQAAQKLREMDSVHYLI